MDPARARTINPAARVMSANAAIRALAAGALALAVAAQAASMVASTDTPWGAGLSVPVVIVTALALSGAAALVALIEASAAALLLRAASRGDFVFVRWGIAGTAGAIVAEAILSGIMVLFGWLLAGALFDVSSGRVNVLVAAIALAGFPAVLLMLAWRKVAVLSPSAGTLRVCPLTSPLVSQPIALSALEKLELGLGGVVRAYRRGHREPIDLGELASRRDEEHIAYATALGAACGLPVSGLARIAPVPAPRHAGGPLPLP